MEKPIEKPDKITLSQNIRRSAKTFCHICQKPVKLLTFAETAGYFETDVQRVFDLSKHTGLHLLHNRKGAVMVCNNSVEDILNQRRMMISNPRIVTLKPIN